MGLYRDHVLPHLVDATCGTPALRGWRERVTAGLRGDVLEIGFGSGHNTPHYPSAVRRVHAVEPALRARRLAEQRVSASHVAVEHVGLDGARIPLPDGTCDAALSTFTLCTIPEVERALAEVRRVLTPGGTVHVLEHGVAPEPAVARAQRWLEPVQQRVADGCHLTRDPVVLLERAGFEVLELEQQYAVTRSPWTYLTLAVARAPIKRRGAAGTADPPGTWAGS
jgi:ubiquinone/menaquinone biosynthesis C-methylase UbiE